MAEPWISEERQAELRPKLGALIAELAKMRELEATEIEPATTWPWRENRDEP